LSKSAEVKARVEALLDEGLTEEEIADELGISVARVEKIVMYMEVPKTDPVLTILPTVTREFRRPLGESTFPDNKPKPSPKVKKPSGRAGQPLPKVSGPVTPALPAEERRKRTNPHHNGGVKKTMADYEDKHGTLQGYKAHVRYKVPVCDECTVANNEYNAQFRKSRGQKTMAERKAEYEANRPPCGEYAAVAAHRKRGEPIDDLCREAQRKYSRANYYKSTGGVPAAEHWANVRAKDVCGTLVGAKRHQSAREKLCDKCLVPMREYKKRLYRINVNKKKGLNPDGTPIERNDNQNDQGSHDQGRTEAQAAPSNDDGQEAAGQARPAEDDRQDGQDHHGEGSQPAQEAPGGE
jgi:hypothetical protein